MVLDRVPESLLHAALCSLRVSGNRARQRYVPGGVHRLPPPAHHDDRLCIAGSANGKSPLDVRQQASIMADWSARSSSMENYLLEYRHYIPANSIGDAAVPVQFSIETFHGVSLRQPSWPVRTSFDWLLGFCRQTCAEFCAVRPPPAGQTPEQQVRRVTRATWVTVGRLVGVPTKRLAGVFTKYLCPDLDPAEAQVRAATAAELVVLSLQHPFTLAKLAFRGSVPVELDAADIDTAAAASNVARSVVDAGRHAEWWDDEDDDNWAVPEPTRAEDVPDDLQGDSPSADEADATRGWDNSPDSARAAQQDATATSEVAHAMMTAREARSPQAYKQTRMAVQQAGSAGSSPRRPRVVWSEDELKVFYNGVATHGWGNWAPIASHLPNRTAKDVKDKARNEMAKNPHLRRLAAEAGVRCEL